MMNRETKIGLLVGLAFTLVIGILLSDHITSSTEPAYADMFRAADVAQRSLDTPAPKSQTPRMLPVEPEARGVIASQDVIRNPAPIESAQVVPQPTALVRIEVPADETTPPAVPASQIVRAQPDQADAATLFDNQPNDPILAALKAQSSEHGMEIVPAIRTQPQTLVGQKSADHMGIEGAPVKEYVAEPGDSLSKLARKFLGSDTPANRDAIVALNPSLQKNRNLILVGQTYKIPLDAWSALVPIVQEESASTAPAPAKSKSYTVQPGDSLWKIAEKQLGSAERIDAIRAMNSEALRGSDTLRVGMVLQLPTN